MRQIKKGNDKKIENNEIWKKNKEETLKTEDEKLIHMFKKKCYETWNNIHHYTQTEINGGGPCEPSLTS